jgi:hypothetical protein
MNGNWGWLLVSLLGGLVFLVVGIWFWTDYSFQILTIIVFLNAMATITLWQSAARRPETLKKKFLKCVFDSKPITPKHQPPPPLKKGYAVGKEKLQFFSDFEDFANVVNWYLASPYSDGGPWRLQELPEADLSLHGNFDSGPVYGRNYAIFHNQQRLGILEISDGFQYSAENPDVITHVQLDFVRVLSFDAIRTFLTNIAHHTCDFRPGTKEYFQAEQAIDRAMTEVLWQINRVSRFGLDFEDDYGEINLRLDGTATWYVERRDCEAFQKGNWKTEVR